MHPEFIIKGLLGIVFLVMCFDILKSKPEFGVQYRIKKIGTKNLLLENLETEETLIAKKSLLYHEENFSPGDIVQMHTIWQHGKKTVEKLKKV